MIVIRRSYAHCWPRAHRCSLDREGWVYTLRARLTHSFIHLAFNKNPLST